MEDKTLSPKSFVDNNHPKNYHRFSPRFWEESNVIMTSNRRFFMKPLGRRKSDHRYHFLLRYFSKEIDCSFFSGGHLTLIQGDNYKFMQVLQKFQMEFKSDPYCEWKCQKFYEEEPHIMYSDFGLKKVFDCRKMEYFYDEIFLI